MDSFQFGSSRFDSDISTEILHLYVNGRLNDRLSFNPGSNPGRCTKLCLSPLNFPTTECEERDGEWNGTKQGALQIPITMGVKIFPRAPKVISGSTIVKSLPHRAENEV